MRDLRCPRRGDGNTLGWPQPCCCAGARQRFGQECAGGVNPWITPLYYAVVVLRGTASSGVLRRVQSWALPGGTDLLWATWSKDNSSTLPSREGCCDSDTLLSWPVHRNQCVQQHNTG